MTFKRILITLGILNFILLTGFVTFWVINSRGTQPDIPMQNSPEISYASVTLHSVATNCWTIVGSKVYDLTPYIGLHPDESLYQSVCGKDGTIALLPTDNQPQAVKSQKLLPAYYIGILVP